MVTPIVYIYLLKMQLAACFKQDTRYKIFSCVQLHIPDNVGRQIMSLNVHIVSK